MSDSFKISNVLLISAVVDPETVEDLSDRISLRSQLHQGRLGEILDKMSTFNNELLNRKIDEIWELEESDAEAIYGDPAVSSTMDPATYLIISWRLSLERNHTSISTAYFSIY